MTAPLPTSRVDYCAIMYAASRPTAGGGSCGHRVEIACTKFSRSHRVAALSPAASSQPHDDMSFGQISRRGSCSGLAIHLVVLSSHLSDPSLRRFPLITSRTIFTDNLLTLCKQSARTAEEEGCVHTSVRCIFVLRKRPSFGPLTAVTQPM